MKVCKPKPMWAVACPDGRPIYQSGVRDAKRAAKARSMWCAWCGAEGQPHRAVEYRAVEEEPGA